jgi:hypothetical protein
MELKTFFAQDQSGNVMPLATVTVYQAGTMTLATGLETQDGTPLTNPFNGDSDGKVAFYAPDGLYDISVVSGARSVSIRVQFSADAQDLRDELDDPTGSSLVGFLQSGTGSQARTAQNKMRESVSVKDFGAVGDGVADDTSAIQAAIDAVTLAGGGVVVAPPGAYLVAGDGIINVKANVILRGSGAATRFVSGAGGRNGNHVFVYLKDGAAIEDCRLSGSDFVRQSGGAAYVGYNKIGVTTQGAALGRNMRISRVGFEKFLNSHVFVFDAHADVLIDGCYTFGQQVGSYADIDANYEVTGWNATQDNGRLVAGTQVYCLTNFYNSGTGTTDVVITNGRHININDAFVGINGNSSRHTISNNVFVKNAPGYYGGWGIDIATGDDCIALGNYIAGGSAGVKLFGSVGCTIAGNTFACDRGVWIFDPNTQRNMVSGNTIKLTSNIASLATKVGVSIQGAVNNSVTGNMIDCQSIANAKGVFLETAGSGATGNSISTNVIANAVTGIESADSSNDSNFAQANIFRSVTTAFPRQINSNFFQNVKGISGTASNCNNLGGTVTVTGASTSQAVTFTNLEPDSTYNVMLSVRSSSGAPAAGAFTPVAPTSITTSGFTVNLQSAPGVGNSVSYNWFLYRA